MRARLQPVLGDGPLRRDRASRPTRRRSASSTAAVSRPPSTSGLQRPDLLEVGLARTFVARAPRRTARSRARSGPRPGRAAPRSCDSTANCLHVVAGDVPLLGDHLRAAELRHLLGAVAGDPARSTRRTGSVKPNCSATRHRRARSGSCSCSARRPRRRGRRCRSSRPARRSARPAGYEPHCRSTVVPGTSSGSPAASQHVRAMSPACGPIVSTQPNTTSSTAAGSTPVRVDQRADRVRAEIGRVHLAERRRRACPTGVRTASTM